MRVGCMWMALCSRFPKTSWTLTRNWRPWPAKYGRSTGPSKEHGAIDFVECVGDDVPYGELTSFPRAVQAKDDELVIFSWITYESRQKRDEVNAKVMADPRLKMAAEESPFDGKRMIFGGFQTLVRA
jgi:uncharacterized protein YbaA (DUF1428 family)